MQKVGVYMDRGMSRIYVSEDKKTIVVWQEDAAPVMLTLIGEDAPVVSERPMEVDYTQPKPKPYKYEPTEKQKKSGYKCAKCGTPGHNAKTCNRKKDDEPEVDTLELIDKVAELKGKGLSSGEIAKKLGISLADVNDLW